MVGAVISNYGQAVQSVKPPAGSTGSQQFWFEFWKAVFTKNPKVFERLKSKPIEHWLGILYSPRYSEIQKFEAIFGVKVEDLKKDLKQQLLGDVFEWVSNLFSQENLRKIETGLRQGQQISNSIANALNILRNNPGTKQTANELTQITDTQSSLYFGAQNFYQKYGPLMLLGGGALLLILLMKK